MDEKIKEAMRQSVVAKVKTNGSLANLTQSDIASYIGGMKERIAAVLPKHLTAERIIQMAATTIQRNPQIAKCSAASLLGGVMQASILGFPPVDSLGYCYFVPYGGECQFQIGYRGLIELARRSGKIKMVYAEVVRQGDDFNAEFGLEPKLEHKPSFDSSKPMTHVYAVCHFVDGGYNFVVLSRSDVERLRMRSPMQKAAPVGAWKTDYDAMAKAKAIKQLAKYLPLNIDQLTAISSDEQVIKPESFDENGNYKVEEASFEEVPTQQNSQTGNEEKEGDAKIDQGDTLFSDEK